MNRGGSALLGSFKLKLSLYFALLTLLPAGAAVWGFTSASAESAARRVDARLQDDLRVALARYQERANAAQGEAAKLAANRPFQVALLRRNRAALEALLRAHPNLAVRSGRFRVGRVPTLAAHREADVITHAGLAGVVVASLPLAGPGFASGLRLHDRVVVLERARIVGASPPLRGTVAIPPGEIQTISVGGSQYRTLAAPSLAGVDGVRIAVLAPQSEIDAAGSSERDRLLVALLFAALLVAAVAYIEARSILRTLRGLADAARGIAEGRLAQRVPVKGNDELATLGRAFNDMADQLQARLADLDAERARLRTAISRFGEALATNDVDELLRVVVETAVEATGAKGATIHTAGLSAMVGDPDAKGERLEHELAVGGEHLGTLALVGTFDVEERMTAASLAAHAAVALENARLHAVVERQALFDGLTGIANRRGSEEALAHEIARAGRMGTPFTLVVADLDDFKRVNDVHGHEAGDDVLREFASVLRVTLRESDLPGRWGGEEFVLLLPGTDAEGGSQLAERIRSALRERSFHGRDGAVFTVTASFGVAQLRPREGERQLFAAADRALYQAKRLGKDRVELQSRIRTF